MSLERTLLPVKHPPSPQGRGALRRRRTDDPRFGGAEDPKEGL